MDVLVCIKRVLQVGATVQLTADGRAVDPRYLGFMMSPHEECAVEEAVRIVARGGGTSTVLTLGPPAALEQLQYAMSLGVDRAILLDAGAADDAEWGPQATAAAIVGAVQAEREAGRSFDLLLFGNEAADTGDYQVAVRVAVGLGIDAVTGVKAIELDDGLVRASREHGSRVETFDLRAPAVCAVMEGLNLPHYPSLPGRLKAKSKPVTTVQAQWKPEGLTMRKLHVPKDAGRQAIQLGSGPEAAPRIVEVLRDLGLVGR